MTRQPLEDDGVLCLDARADYAESRTWSSAEIAVLSRRAPGKDGPNEDAAFVLPLSSSSILLAVADGCGGMPAGDIAARNALEALARVVGGGEGNDAAGAVLAGFDAANEAVLGMRSGSGTTLAAVLVSDNEARVFHVGDSAVFIAGQRGRTRFSATQHSPTGFGVEAGLLTEQEAMTHDDRTYVLNVVGSTSMFVEISQPIALRPRDTILLASDGLTDNLMNDRVVGMVRFGPCMESLCALADAAERQMNEAEHGHPDDLTMIAFRPVAQNPS